MKRRWMLISFAASLALLVQVTTVSAAPIISVDMDPVMGGIQSTLTVAPGATFSVDVVYTGDGMAIFDTVVLDVAFNDAGAVLSLGPGPTPGAPTAGSLAGTVAVVADFFAFVTVGPGGALTPDLIPPAPGFAGGIGGVGLQALLPGPFPLVAAGTTIDLFSLTFNASSVGTSSVFATGFPLGGGFELALVGQPVLTNLAGGTVTVASAAVPEPGTLLLLGSGFAALAAARAVQRRRRD